MLPRHPDRRGVLSVLAVLAALAALATALATALAGCAGGGTGAGADATSDADTTATADGRAVLDRREANVVGVTVERRDGGYRFAVSLLHDDGGEAGYAN